MSTLHMEVETARGAQSSMTNTHQQLTSLMQSMNSQVTGLQPVWQGNSASEFFGLYDQWKSATNAKLEELNNMATRLQTEISEWEQMASKLA